MSTVTTEDRYLVEFDDKGDEGRYAVIDTNAGDGQEVAPVSLHSDPDAADTVARRLNQAHREREERKGMVAGLRALANFLESTPELPVHFVLGYYTVRGKDAREQLGTIVQHLGDFEVKDRAPSDLRLERTFFKSDRPGGLSVQYVVNATREDACTPRVEDGKVVWDLPTEVTTHRESVA